MFSAAFDKPVYGEGKNYQFPRATLCQNVMHAQNIALSPAADDAFPQLLTSLSMAKEKYHQPPGALAYRIILPAAPQEAPHSPHQPPVEPPAQYWSIPQ